MKKLFIAMATAVALVVTMMNTAVAADAEITSPSPDAIVYENALQLAAFDYTAPDNSVRWAVRYGTCDAATGTVAGNVDGFSDSFTWSGGEFAAMLDISGWDAGQYCFVFNTELGDAAGHRLSQWFYVVDDYAIVGGTLFMGEAGSGNSPTHALDGIVGDAGAAGVVGYVTVNYRLLGETVTYEPFSISLEPASGVTGNFDIAKAVIYATDGTQIQVLDRDATPTFPRGAIIVRPSPDDIDYRIGGLSGSDSWVGMDRGNNHVGTR